MLSELSRGEKVAGAKQVRRALTGGRAKAVYLARDADPAMTAPLETLAEERGVPVHWVDAMGELGRACGIRVNTAVAAAV